jgi:hypothetical protein
MARCGPGPLSVVKSAMSYDFAVLTPEAAELDDLAALAAADTVFESENLADGQACPQRLLANPLAIRGEFCGRLRGWVGQDLSMSVRTLLTSTLPSSGT